MSSRFLTALPPALAELATHAVPVAIRVGAEAVPLVATAAGAAGRLGSVVVEVDLEADPAGARWTTVITNVGDVAIENLTLAPFDLSLDLSTTPDVPRVRHLSGSWHYDAVYPPRAFRIGEEAFLTHDHARRVKIGGINSGIHSPLLQVGFGSPMRSGFFVGLEWSGGWRIEAGWAELSFHGEDQPPFRVVATADLEVDRLEAGQSLSLPAVHIGGGEVASWDELSNRQRSQMRALRPTSGLERFPVSYDTWFGRYEQFDIETLMADATRAAELGVEVFCLDACWYRSDHVHSGLGNWSSPDPHRFPNGADDVRALADHVRSLGMRFGLWHLIQLAAPDTDVVRARPELFREPATTEARERAQRDFGRLDEPEMTSFNGLVLALERPEAVAYALDVLERWIRDWGVDWFRFESVPFDGVEYNAGYNDLLDQLRLRHPGLYIEACNGGGQRLDLNSVRRTHGNWLSDHTSAPEVTRFNQTGALRFWPAHMLNMAVTAFAGSADRQATLYEAMSRMVGPLSFNGAIAEWSDEAVARLRIAVDTYKGFREHLDGDVHFPLPQPRSVEDWDAVQFRREGSQDSLLMVFRLEGAPTQDLVLSHTGSAEIILASSDETRWTPTLRGGEIALPPRSAAIVLLRADPRPTSRRTPRGRSS